MIFTQNARQPFSAPLESLRTALADLADATNHAGPWHSGAFRTVVESGLLAGFIGSDDGGLGASEAALLSALEGVAAGCLTTALVLTQWASACRIIATGSAELRARMLPALASGQQTTTVGVAQLTTSRRHLAGPALQASALDGTWRLDGTCPWVTGADSSDSLVTGALTAAGEALFFVVPTAAAGLVISPPMRMLALSGSRTASIRFSAVEPAAVIVPHAHTPPRAGGLATTALAIGATRGSVAILDREAKGRPAIGPVAQGFRDEAAALAARLAALANRAESDHEDPSAPADRDGLRTAANGLVVRAAQAALTASKGAGFIAGHPAERAVREAMLFLVWSCPQQVATAMLCELAHLDSPA